MKMPKVPMPKRFKGFNFDKWLWDILNKKEKTEKERQCDKCGEIIKGDEEETLCANCAL